ncbi:hypothetical protein BDV28DRAFT_149052 [Aspergillus coremiiformis]|uniref:Uncharacterized protein n=1 Tax=Aspergillus coremiiformis TaxID=138285 RepID=A0A5N6Z672_9EURO|nr:hypothetical protein BDV28DRAFT_149052 [Aspergillus coremiiformis]
MESNKEILDMIDTITRKLSESDIHPVLWNQTAQYYHVPPTKVLDKVYLEIAVRDNELNPARELLDSFNPRGKRSQKCHHDTHLPICEDNFLILQNGCEIRKDIHVHLYHLQNTGIDYATCIPVTDECLPVKDVVKATGDASRGKYLQPRQQDAEKKGPPPRIPPLTDHIESLFLMLYHSIRYDRASRASYTNLEELMDRYTHHPTEAWKTFMQDSMYREFLTKQQTEWVLDPNPNDSMEREERNWEKMYVRHEYVRTTLSAMMQKKGKIPKPSSGNAPASHTTPEMTSVTKQLSKLDLPD